MLKNSWYKVSHFNYLSTGLLMKEVYYRERENYFVYLLQKGE